MKWFSLLFREVNSSSPEGYFYFEALENPGPAED